MEALAAIMAANSSAALDFEDPGAAIEPLSASHDRPGIISATIVDSNDVSFAHFGREVTVKSRAQLRRRRAFWKFANEWRHTVPIVRNGRSLGFIHLRSDYAVCRNELLRVSIGIMNAVLACSMIQNLLLTTRPQKFITHPMTADTGGKQASRAASAGNVSMKDNGVGIPAEKITCIFQHGFGLHSGALAAKEMGGNLGVHSDGFSPVATFTLSLPIAATNSLA